MIKDEAQYRKVYFTRRNMNAVIRVYVFTCLHFIS
ncbi:MAG: hypothetical protein HFACDABA_03160 [Anaerolineales bacterium]|nr:hypothetical protein [Anaerolineales bacterium]